MDNAKKPADELDRIFPLDQFGRGISWTKQGSSDGLEDRMHSLVDDMFKHSKPKAGIFYFEQLPDGGYELKTYRSND